MSTVIQEVDDVDPPAMIEPEEAQAIVRSQWESQVEHAVRVGSVRTEIDDIMCMVLTFSRHPRALDTALRRSTLGQRAASCGEDVQPPWANGAKILVPGLTAELWSTGSPHINLGPYHVVMLPRDEADVMAALDAIGRRRPRLKAGPASRIVKLPADRFELFADDSAVHSSEAAAASGHSHADYLLDGEHEAREESENGEEMSREAEEDEQSEAIRRAWIEAVRDAAQTAQIVHLGINRTFVEEPVEPAISPRTICTESAPADMSTANASSANPRLWSPS